MGTTARRNNSGKSLVFAALVVALALLSAAVLRPRQLPYWIAGILWLFPGGIVLAEIRGRKILARGSTAGETLRESELRFRNAFQEAAVGMVILDVAGRIQSANKGFTDIMLYSAAELIGQRLILLTHPDHHADILRDRGLVLDGKVRNYRAERRFVRKDGIPVWVRTSVSLLQLNGERHTIALVEDITEQKQARDELNRQALRDPLTGLPNRRHFQEVIEAAICLNQNTLTQSAGSSREVALLYIDLDGFKLINDTMGHRFGDRLLKAVSGRVRACLPDSAHLARVGGDEFAIVLTGLDGPAIPGRVAEGLLGAFHLPFQVDGHEIGIGVSVGISRYPLDGQDSSALLQSADAAMYCAKRSGSNRYQFFTSQMRQDAHQRLTIGTCLRRALDNREISIKFQPQYELAGNSLVRFEALCRWFHPDLGHVSPDRFIPVAEETGLIVELGKHVLRESCIQALKWQIGGPPVQLAVNVSAVQFVRADFVDSIVGILRETGLKPALLELELTESCLIRDREDGIHKMLLLKSLGVGISIDDFGTGYSSLSYLQSMPVDAIKVDRSFTAKLGSSQTALSMVRAIIAMARALGLRIVIEGVENSAQVEILRQLGCDEVQGYYYGRPEDAQASVDRVLHRTADTASVESHELVTAE